MLSIFFSPFVLAKNNVTKGGVKGILVNEDTRKPVTNFDLQLIKSDKVQGDKIFISGKSIGATTDKAGAFAFQNIPAGKYIMLSGFNTLTSGGSTVLVDITEGKTTDLGTINVKVQK
jgi:hypothetical protein